MEPFAEGSTFGPAFGNAGIYERVRGTFKGELDPADARNKAIVNIDKAPRNAAGRVEYEADFFMLRPVEAARGNGKLIYDVTNRGRKYIHWRLMDARPKSVAQANDPRTLDDAGNGLLFRMGYTFVWSGWDPDAPRSNNGMSMKPVIATDDGKPIVRVIRDELVNGTRSPLRETFRLTHHAATTDQAQARLTVRRREADARRAIPPSNWSYVNDREIRLLPEGTKPETGSIYEFHYPAKDPRCAGHRHGRHARPGCVPAPRQGGCQGRGKSRSQHQGHAGLWRIAKRALPARFCSSGLQPGRTRAQGARRRAGAHRRRGWCVFSMPSSVNPHALTRNLKIT